MLNLYEIKYKNYRIKSLQDNTLKIGKTEFCSLAPDALILAFEMGTNARPGVYVQPVEKWAEFKTILRQLEQPAVKQKFSTICIDTVSIAYDICEKFICQQAGVQKIGEIPYGGGYAALSKEFESSLRRITMLGYGLIMTCHLKENSNSDGEVIGYKPDLNNRCLKIVNGLVDVIGVITQTWNEKGESERWIQTRATPTVAAGSRFRYLAPKIPFGYNGFVKALADAIEAEEQHGATVVDHKENTDTTTAVPVVMRSFIIESCNVLKKAFQKSASLNMLVKCLRPTNSIFLSV